VLIERLDLSADAAFELLRAAARRSRTKIHALVAAVVRRA
jgi:AmiR/NasT family two-component response regulator